MQPQPASRILQGDLAAGHRGHPGGFENDPAEPLAQVSDELVEEILPRVGDADHEALEQTDGLATVRPTEHLAGDGTLDDAEFPKDPAIPSRVLDPFAGAQSGEAMEAQVDADLDPRLRH